MEERSFADSTVQYVYLDFDGELTTYRNEDLNITVDVEVKDSGMSEEQKRYILAELSEMEKMSPEDLVNQRYDRFRKIEFFMEKNIQEENGSCPANV